MGFPRIMEPARIDDGKGGSRFTHLRRRYQVWGHDARTLKVQVRKKREDVRLERLWELQGQGGFSGHVCLPHGVF